MPLQVKRLLLVFAVLIGVMIGLKILLTPESWREYGAYRGNAIKEIANQEPKYVDMETCAMCHDSIAELKLLGEHRTIQCEICHGPGYLHIEDEDNINMEIPLGNGICMRCHTINPAVSANVIKQVDELEHSDNEECINCHNPHEPWL